MNLSEALRFCSSRRQQFFQRHEKSRDLLLELVGHLDSSNFIENTVDRAADISQSQMSPSGHLLKVSLGSKEEMNTTEY